MRACDLDLSEQISLLSGSTFWLTSLCRSERSAGGDAQRRPHGLRAQEGTGRTSA